MGLSSPAVPVEMAPEDMARLADLLRRRAGIRLAAPQRAMLQSRLSRRLRHTGLPDFASYTAFVQSAEGAEELQAMVASLTTNVTQFFRQRYHFAHLRDRVFPSLLEAARAGRSVRIWSAGSSNGQEAYSIAIALALSAPDLFRHDIRILGTDIDAAMIAAARVGVYDAETMAAVPARLRERFFTAGAAGYQIAPALRNLVTFHEHNLHADWPMRRRFDIIFCRNVAIYFDLDAQTRLWQRMQEQLAPGGWFYLGHSERILPYEGWRLERVAPTTYHLPLSSTQDAVPKYRTTRI